MENKRTELLEELRMLNLQKSKGINVSDQKIKELQSELAKLGGETSGSGYRGRSESLGGASSLEVPTERISSDGGLSKTESDPSVKAVVVGGTFSGNDPRQRALDNKKFLEAVAFQETTLRKGVKMSLEEKLGLARLMGLYSDSELQQYLNTKVEG